MNRNVMKKALVGVMLLGAGLILCTGEPSPSHAALPAPDEAVTFSNQVVRIFQDKCQVCHHPGDIAPFSLMTYEEAYPRAQLIKAVTQSRYMPPWKPVDGCGEFQNTRGLTEDEMATIARWVDAGAPEGDPQDLPPPREFTGGWVLGEPDVVVEMESEYMPDPYGDDVYRCFTIPTDFAQDQWVNAVDIRPGNRAIVHHVLLFIDRSGRSVQLDEAEPGPGYTCFGGPGFEPANRLEATEFLLGGWVPGSRPNVLPDGVAARIPAGARIVIQVHYSPNGNPETDRTKIGLYFPTAPVTQPFRTLPIRNDQFVIPAGADHHLVPATFSIPSFLAMHAIGIAPHMHLLGREMQVTATLPDGQVQCLIHINDWDFHWQGGYQFKEPVPLPGGTTINVAAYYDNSANNPLNPNSPPQDVRWGDRTVDEMCLVFIGFTVDAENLGKQASPLSPDAKQFLTAIEEQSAICRGH